MNLCISCLISVFLLLDVLHTLANACDFKICSCSVLTLELKTYNIVVCFCVATAYGKGVYFSRYFWYSAQHVFSPPDKDKKKYVFQCRVLTGHFRVGKPDLVEPPVRDKKSLSLYNSVVDNAKNPVIFVIFHDNQVYPEYLITFFD